MSIPMDATCYKCRIDRIVSRIDPLGTPAQTNAFLKRWMAMAAQYPDYVDSSRCGYYTDKLVKQTYGVNCADLMVKDRALSNRFALERMEGIQSRIAASRDPVYAALQYAVLGNYLDFAALAGKVSFQELEEMLDKARELDLDKAVAAELKRDLETGKRLLILTDNAGEIVFDRVLAQTLQRQFPHLQITFCVRGFPVANDATREDAQAVGIEFPVIDSGNAVGGTAPELMSRESLAALEAADVVLAKGMGNTESLYGSPYNVYYAFLVKCRRFMEYFDAPMMKPMLIREKRADT